MSGGYPTATTVRATRDGDMLKVDCPFCGNPHWHHRSGGPFMSFCAKGEYQVLAPLCSRGDQS